MPGIFFRTFQRFALAERSFFLCLRCGDAKKAAATDEDAVAAVRSWYDGRYQLMLITNSALAPGSSRTVVKTGSMVEKVPPSQKMTP